MNSLENLKAKGQLHVVLTSADGSVKEDHLINNLVVDTGLNFIVSQIGRAHV